MCQAVSLQPLAYTGSMGLGSPVYLALQNADHILIG